MSNPILRKEVLTSLRTRKALAMQVVYLLALIAVVFMLWPPGGMQSLGGDQAQRLLAVLGIGQLLLIALFAPAFTSTALTLEKERNTFESLFATRLSPAQIVVGKMGGSLTFLLLLVVMGTPVLASLFLLGGVRGGQVLAVLGVLVVTALFLGAIGLLVSAMMHRSYRSIIMTYGILLVVTILLAMPAWPATGQLMLKAGPVGSKVLGVLASLSPLQAMLSVVVPDSSYATPAKGLPPYWQLYLPMAAVVFVVVGGFLLARLQRPFQPQRPRERLKVVERGQISARTFFFLFDPAKRKPAIRFWQNVVAMKEFRTRPVLQVQWLLRATGIALIVSILLMFMVTLTVGQLVQEGPALIAKMLAVVAGLQILLIILIGPAMSSGSICSDRETSVWDLMNTSRIRSWTIVSGKFQASIVPLLLLIVATTPALLILMVFPAFMGHGVDEGLAPRITRVLMVTGMTSLFVTVLGMFFSAMCSRTAAATAWTYGMVGIVSVATLLVMLGPDLFSDEFKAAVFVPNAIAAALDAAGLETFQQFSLFNAHLKLIATVTVGLFLATVVRVWQLRRPV